MPPVAGGYRIVMQRQSPHIPANFFHHHFGPVVIIGNRTAGYFFEMGARIIAGINSITLVLVGIKLRCHIAAAAPALVTYAPISLFVWRRLTVLSAQLRHGAFAVE